MNSSLPFAVLAMGVVALASAQEFDPALLFDPLVPLPPTGQGRLGPGNEGPWNNDVIVYRVATDRGSERLATFERAGVATLARLNDGRLIAAHQHFPANDSAAFDKVAVRFSTDEGKTWTAPAVIRLQGLPEGMRFPFDPTLVPLPDGRVRLYFTSLRGRRFDQDLPQIHSAISDNGVDYVYEPGVRFGIAGRAVIDCAVVLHQGVFHLFSPDNGAQPQPRGNEGRGPQMQPQDGIGYHAMSSDGLTFKRADDVRIEGRRRWLGNAQSDGERILFFGTGEPEPQREADANRRRRGGVFIASSNDGKDWQVLDGPEMMGADPGAVAGANGGWIVIVTGPPRSRDRSE